MESTLFSSSLTAPIWSLSPSSGVHPIVSIQTRTSSLGSHPQTSISCDRVDEDPSLHDSYFPDILNEHPTVYSWRWVGTLLQHGQICNWIPTELKAVVFRVLLVWVFEQDAYHCLWRGQSWSQDSPGFNLREIWTIVMATLIASYPVPPRSRMMETDTLYSDFSHLLNTSVISV